MLSSIREAETCSSTQGLSRCTSLTTQKLQRRRCEIETCRYNCANVWISPNGKSGGPDETRSCSSKETMSVDRTLKVYLVLCGSDDMYTLWIRYVEKMGAHYHLGMGQKRHRTPSGGNEFQTFPARFPWKR